MTKLVPPLSVLGVPAAYLRVVTGSEEFLGLDAVVGDFWRFAMGDLRSNTTRGLLAEFLVQRAVGGTGIREEWAEYDVMAPDGTRIEVKSAARLQAWAQRKQSAPGFSGLRSRTLTEDTGRSAAATHHADAYVFCLHTATDPAAYDPLDVDQWQFVALNREVVEAYGCASMRWSTVLRLAGDPVHHRNLAAALGIRSSGVGPEPRP